MSIKQHHNTTPEFTARLDNLKRFIYENRDREVTQSELRSNFSLTHQEVNAVCNNLQANNLIYWTLRDKRYYKWRGDDLELLNKFMTCGKTRVNVREFRI